MTCSRLRLITVLRACLLFITCVVCSEENPQEDEEHRDEWFFNFVTRPDIKAPKFHVQIHDENAISPGYWFIAPYYNINKRVQGDPWEGAYIYDGHGDLIWAGPPDLNYYNVHDFKVSNFNNTDALTAIYPLENAGLVWNSHYEIVKTVAWTSAWETANMHEFHLIENGTRALTTTRDGYRELSLEESRTVGFEDHCLVRADGIEELDITSDPPQLLFKWVGIEHIPLEHSVKGQKPEKVKEQCEGNWDLHHINSVDKFADGDYLVSFKVLNTIFKVSHKDGSIIWRFGGLHSDFPIDQKMRFSDQHIPRIIEESSMHVILSIFDNAGGKHARGMVVKLDLHSMTAELVQEAPHPLDETMGSRGSTQLLANGNLFSCWAEWSRITEHDSSGKQLMFAHFKRKGKMPTYRGYKFQWVGRPSDPPNVYSAAFALGRDRKRIITSVSVSWNGATEVGSYKLFESNAEETQWKLLNKTDRAGFETNMQYEGFAEYVLVDALGHDGRPLGRSRVVRTLPPVQGVANDQKAVDWSHGPTDMHFKGCDLEGALSEFSRFQDSRKILANPIATYIAGVFTVIGIWLGFRLAKSSQCQLWRLRAAKKYMPSDSKGYRSLLGDEEEDDLYEDTKLDDHRSEKLRNS